ncbi:protein ALTERED PHOSPHATE STARVATION RESPONSE 1-like [Trifolium pratense]|uniref:protein ALTERED PHOSPHATE STARVATION RESPONSE 1-like n=1 Tax=Trifolium pratense TaxID=57577 RepID=UPI001E697B85|nr:protein ALTERED PHOSPHATE STARVATION RESPONSE 1-like [Trifolium pratense]
MSSKLQKSSLLSLCKQRKEIIKAAKYCRYDLASSFDIYLESLLKLGNSLNQYVEQDFVIFDHSCINLEFPSDDSDFDHLHFDDDEEEEEELSNVDFNLESNDESIHACNHRASDGTNMRNSGKPRVQFENTTQAQFNLHHGDNIHHNIHHNIHDHMHMSHQDFGHYEHSQRKENIQRVHRYEHYGSKPFPMVVSPKHNVAATFAPPPAPPPPPKAYNWDLLYPFNMNYEVPNYDRRDEDERKIREREGIPDLEDESELSSNLSSNANYNAAGLNSNRDSFSSNEEEIKRNLEPKITIEECESLSGVPTPVSSRTLSIKEAVLDIKSDCKHIYDCGREFSLIIEAGKIPYHSVSTELRAFAACVLVRILPSIPSCLHPSYMPQKPAPRTKKLSKAKMQNNQDHTKIGHLSSTLEQLYAWEKKLYEEVLGEEKLRIPYDKLHKRLKKLDKNGAESDKIDDTLDSIKLIQSEINVAVRSISVISRQINELTDDKLLPELNKLIDGLIGLWKTMSTCHQKQFQAINKSKSHVHILDPSKKKKSSTKATKRLEKVILKWGKSFNIFINKQKTLVKYLNAWLQKCTLQETEDKNNPSLQGDLRAPPIFGVCNNWYNAINKVSQVEVTKAINNFASNLHKLYEKLKEEKKLKVRVKYQFKDYKQRFRSYYKDRIKPQNYHSFIKMKASTDFDEDEIPLLNVSVQNLTISRKRLIEERRKHQQVVKDANDISSCCFQEGLTPIFEALWKFSVENLKIYERLRVSNTMPHQ